MMVSKYFDWDEVSRTSTGIYNDPEGLELKSNVVKCALKMDKVRELFGKPVNVSSWYRNRMVNTKVGGAKNSAHLTGWAVDFKVQGMQDLEVALRIVASDIKYDQVILEPNWIHISFAPTMRMQALTLKERGGKYLQGIVI